MSKNLTNAEVRQLGKHTAPADAEAFQMVEKNRWFFVTIFLLIIICMLVINTFSLQSEALKPPVTNWVKLYPDGHWKVEAKSPDSVQDFYHTTIDKLLNDYLEYRFQEIPQTI